MAPSGCFGAGIPVLESRQKGHARTKPPGGGSIPQGMWVEAHLTCLVFVFARFGAAPGFKWRPFVL